MKREAQLVRATLQVLTEAVWAERISLDELKRRSGVEEPLFTLVCDGVERFADGAVLRDLADRREPFLWVARQAREELSALLGSLEPVQATAILCGLPGAARLGYAAHRLAARFGTAESAVREWERSAYEQAADHLTDRLPLLDAVRQSAMQRTDLWEQIAETEAVPAEAVDEPMIDQVLESETRVTVTDPLSNSETSPDTNQPNATLETPVTQTADSHLEKPDDLIERAAADPGFDLRLYMTPALELAIRQAFHRHGAQSPEKVRPLFSTTEQLAVDLVYRRIGLETAGGEEESLDA